MKVSIRIPDDWEKGLGYPGEARYVAFYWEPGGDELAWDDGREAVVGANWHAWLAWTREYEFLLHFYDFGSSDGPAVHWLLLDRKTRDLDAMEPRLARKILKRQWRKRRAV